MTAECVITEAGTGTPTFDTATGYTTPATPVQHYSGRCRVQGTFRPADVVATDQATATRRYLVAIPASTTGIEERMTVKITAAPKAPQMVGRFLTITAIEYANEQFELDLLCDEVEFQGS